MADDTSLDFRIRISTPADVSGAEAARKAIDELSKSSDGVEGAGEAGAKGLAKMVREAGTVREAQRIAQGFFDVFLGGGRTIEGTAEIMRFFIATAADINPIFATIAVLGSSLAVVAGRQHEHTQKMEEGALGADALQKALEPLAKEITNVSEAAKGSVEGLKDAETIELDTLKALLDAEKNRTAELTKQLELRQQNTQLMLEDGRRDELKANKGGPLGALQINEKYDQMKLVAKGVSDRQRLEVEARSHQKQMSLAQDALADAEMARSQQVEELRRIYAARPKAQAQADAFHLQRDEKGTFEGTAAALQIQLDNAKKLQSDNAQKRNDPLIDTLLATKDEQREQRRQVAIFDDINVKSLQAAFDAAKQAAQAEENVKTVAPSLEEQVKASDGKIAELTTLVSTLQSQKQTDYLTQQKNDLEDRKSQDDLDQKALQEKREQANKDFEEANNRKLAELARMAGDADQSPETREGALRQAGVLRNAALQRQIEHGSLPGPGNKSPEELEDLRREMADNKAETDRQIAAMRDEALGVPAQARPQFDASTRALLDLIAQGSARINGGNNREAQQGLAATAGDPSAQAQFLAQYFGSTGNLQDGRLSQELQQQMALRNAALPPGAGAKDQQFLLSDELDDKLNRATSAADAAHYKLPDTINSAVGYMQRTVAIAQALEASTNPVLISLGQQIAALEAKLASAQSQINSLRTNRH